MSSDWSFPPVPPELKSLAPYFQRAQELRVKDPVMSYWCTYYAAQQGIALKAQSKEAKPFLFQILSILEQMKASLADNDAVADDAGAAYIENFALRVFNMADNEDRKEKATRSTAKKFLASANFFELLRIFDTPVDIDIEEKIRYAKWKAADLAKAFREGRQPTPGDAQEPSAVSLLQPATLEPPSDAAPSMSAWSPGTSLAPSPAVQPVQSLEPSPISGADVPLPTTVSGGSPPEPMQPLTSGSPDQASSSLQLDSGAPSTPSPRSFGRHLNLDRHNDGYTTPGMWSTMATPGTEDVYEPSDAMGGITESPSARAAARRKDVPERMDELPDASREPDTQDDSWSIAANQSMSRQNSWTVADVDVDASLPVPEGVTAPPPLSGIGLGLQPDGIPSVVPVKKVHFSPSVVGGLSSTSSSVAGSSPPGSPGGYTPSLPTVPETTYSSDSDVARQDTSRYDRPVHPIHQSASSAPKTEVEGSSQGPPPVIHKVSSPAGPLSPNGLSSPRDTPKMPPSVLSTHPHIGSPPPSMPKFPAAPGQQAGFGPRLPAPPAPPALHPTPRFPAAPLAPAHSNNHIPPKPPSPTPELTSTQVSRIQKHCRFAISALDYEDAETARKELRSALAMLGG